MSSAKKRRELNRANQEVKDARTLLANEKLRVMLVSTAATVLQQQRDELLSAAEQMLKVGDESMAPADGDYLAQMIKFTDAEDNLRSAVAKAKGENHGLV